MKRICFFLALLAAGCSDIQPVPGPIQTRSTSTDRVLMIDASSMPISAGKVTLTIGALQRTNGVYSGDYKVSVAPYFFKNEQGRLAIIVSDESLAKINQGKVAAIIGTATTSGKSGKSRHIDATATPADINRGKLKLWFAAGDQKMIFEPGYHFADTRTAATQTTKSNLSSNLKSSPAASPGEVAVADTKIP